MKAFEKIDLELSTEAEIYQAKQTMARACGLPEAAAHYIKGETRAEIMKDALAFAKIVGAYQRRETLTEETLHKLARDLRPEAAAKWEELNREDPAKDAAEADYIEACREATRRLLERRQGNHDNDSREAGSGSSGTLSGSTDPAYGCGYDFQT